MKYIVVGAGRLGKIAKLDLEVHYGIHVIGYADMDESKHNAMLDGVMIYSIEESIEIASSGKAELLIAISFPTEELKNMLSKSNVTYKRYTISSNIATTLSDFERGRLSSLKNTHKGERCFIAGNGSSLKGMDLTALKDENLFATNMFALHEELFKINPTYYCLSDFVHWNGDDGFLKVFKEKFPALQKTKFFFEADAKSKFYRTKEFEKIDAYFIDLHTDRKVWEGEFSADPTHGLCWARSVVSDFCLPLAFYMGFSDIYLIGCDFNWNNKGVLEYDNAYFYDYSLDERRKHWKSGHYCGGMRFHVSMTKIALEFIAEYAKNNQINIYNVGVDSTLDMFEQVSFQELFHA